MFICRRIEYLKPPSSEDTNKIVTRIKRIAVSTPTMAYTHGRRREFGQIEKPQKSKTSRIIKIMVQSPTKQIRSTFAKFERKPTPYPTSDNINGSTNFAMERLNS